MFQKLKKFILFAACAALMISLAGCGSLEEHSSKEYAPGEANENSETWKSVEGGLITLEQGNLKLVFDTATTHFKVLDEKNEAEYDSSVLEEHPEAKMQINEKVQSELLVTYYDENSQKQEMNSTEHSVNFQTYEVKTSGNKIRVNYTLQKKAAPPFVPKVLSEEMFGKITEKLDSTNMFKFKLMYKFYPAGSQTTEAKEIQGKYAYAKDHSVYVLGGNTTDADKTVLNRYMEEADYTQEQYLTDLAALNIDVEDDELPMNFTVPVEYELSSDGFCVTVVSDEIETVNGECQLQAVSVLPYFNSRVMTDENGFLLLPDGSGAVMKLDKADNIGYAQILYGEDQTCDEQLSSVIRKNAVMPLMGYSTQNGSFITYVEGASQMATMYAYRAGETEYCPHLYAEFALHAKDSFTMRKSTIALAVFSKEVCAERPKLQYVLLPKEAKLEDMAKWYRSYLQTSGKLSESQNQEAPQLYLEFTGYITQEASFMGVSYEEKIVLSTLAEIQKSVEKLLNEGITNIHVRLKGYDKKGGLYHSMTDGFSLDPKVGAMDELRSLAEVLYRNGGGLYLEDDLQVVYKDHAFDGFSSTKDTVRRLDKTLADVSDFDIVTADTKKGINVRYLVAPKLYQSLAEKFKTEINSESGDQKLYISCAGLGSSLFSDFNTKDEYDRVEASNAIRKSIEILKGQGQLMTDVGNEYALANADHILNMSLAASNLAAENYSVPFYQMVLQGEVSYAGGALNQARDMELEKIQTLISGAVPYYTCVTNGEALRELKGEQKLYPTAFDNLYESMVDFVKENQALSELKAGTGIKTFEITQEGKLRTVYENEAEVLFDTDAKDYVITRK